MDIPDASSGARRAKDNSVIGFSSDSDERRAVASVRIWGILRVSFLINMVRIDTVVHACVCKR